MRNNQNEEFDRLLERFVACFELSGVSTDTDPFYEGDLAWRQDSDPSVLKKLYSQLPAKLPPLYERLLLTYRWFRVSLGGDTEFFGNWPGESPDKLLVQIFYDQHLTEWLMPDGYIQFGSGPIFYDPLCFDTSRPADSGDYPIIQIDHEEIMVNFKLVVVQTIAPSFEQFVRDVIGNS